MQTYSCPPDVREEELATSKGIDEEIRDLLVMLNRVGLKTRGSCCGHGGMGFIGFNGKLNKRELGLAMESIKADGYRILTASTNNNWKYGVTHIEFIRKEG